MSTNTTDPAVDIVCVPGAIPPGERAAHFELGLRVFAELAEERIDLPSGIALRLAGDNLPQVARFVANERKCCPFLHIEVEIAPGAGPMWLRLTGPPGTRELIEAELGLARWLAPFKPLFIVVTATLLGYGHYLVYFAPKKACAEGGACPAPGTTRWMKLVLWSITALALAGLGIEYAESYLIG